MILRSDSIGVVRDAIRAWVNHLSNGSFEEAAQEISTEDSPCSAELLIGAIGSYSRKYREAQASEGVNFVPKITSPVEMCQQGENLVIYVNDESTVIEYDLPVEDSWSDLTAKFKLRELNEKQHALSLLDLRVL